VVNQGSCSNCWAIASTDVVSIRLCHEFGVPLRSRVSHQHVTGCADTTGANGCQGQDPATAWSFMTGDAHTFDCMPEINTDTKDSGCPTRCATNDGRLDVTNGIISGTYIRVKGMLQIKKYLDTVGPLAAAICVPTDFLKFFPTNHAVKTVYTATVYPGCTFGHLLVLLGYKDVDVPVPYWILQNSWGVTHGDDGVVYIAQNLADLFNHSYWIDTHCYGAEPRPNPIAPPKTVELIPNNASSEVPLQAKTYTTPYGCPKYIQNVDQEENSAKIDGCPASIVRTPHKGEKHSTFIVAKQRGHKGKNGHSSASRTSSSPHIITIIITIIIVALLALV
jgi:hypothetical protein